MLSCPLITSLSNLNINVQKYLNHNTFKMVAEATKNVRRRMARKGKEADVQVFVKTEEEWEKLLEPQVNTSHTKIITPVLSTLNKAHGHVSS